MRIKGIGKLIMALCMVLISCSVYGTMTNWGWLQRDPDTDRTYVVTASLGNVGYLKWENDRTNLYLDPDLIAGNATTYNGSAIIQPADGGTGQDTSGWSGVPYVTSGTWSKDTSANSKNLSSLAGTSGEFMNMPDLNFNFPNTIDGHPGKLGDVIIFPTTQKATGGSSQGTIILLNSVTKSISTVSHSGPQGNLYESIGVNGKAWTLCAYQKPFWLLETDTTAKTTITHSLTVTLANANGNGRLTSIGNVIYGTASSNNATRVWRYNTATGIQQNSNPITDTKASSITNDGSALYVGGVDGGVGGVGAIYKFNLGSDATAPALVNTKSMTQDFQAGGVAYDADRGVIWSLGALYNSGTSAYESGICALTLSTSNVSSYTVMGSGDPTGTNTFATTLRYDNGKLYCGWEDGVASPIDWQFNVVDAALTYALADGSKAEEFYFKFPHHLYNGVLDQYDQSSIYVDTNIIYVCGYDYALWTGGATTGNYFIRRLYRWR